MMMLSSAGQLSRAIALTTLLIPGALTNAVVSQNNCTDGTRGAVVSGTGLCAQTGSEILRKGGNAADAQIATVLCSGVVGMYHSGIGGGGFMLIRSPAGEYEFIDFRETAPAAANETMYQGNEAGSLRGGLASGVPGELRGLEYLHDNYGSMNWEELVAPAVKIARDGWTVNADLVRYMQSATSSYDFLTLEPEWAIDFAPNGTRLGLGDTITRKRYADTLERIGKYGVDVFYGGPIANATIQALRASNGTMTLDDLANYTVAIREPVSIDYHGYRLHSTASPSSGVVALASLNIIGGYEAVQPSTYDLSTHRLVESFRFAYGMRGQLGDPSFQSNISAYERNMISAETGEEVRSLIVDDMSFNTSYYDPAGIESLETPGTAHIASADSSGLAISMTTTVNLLFGSLLVVPETGVIMNNEMNDFSLPGVTNAFGFIPSPANFIRPGKRPLSSISPIIVESPSGELYFVAGAAGGSRIITSTIQNTWHVLDRGLTAPQAIAEARLHDQLVPNTVVAEWTGANIVGYSNDTAAYLRSVGHNVTYVAPGQSAAQLIRRLANGTFEAASEPRQANSGGFAV